MSPRRAPSSGAGRQIGSERKRSTTPLVRSVLIGDPGVDRREQHAHDEHAGQDVVEVLAGRPLDGAAEQVGEHQDEHHGRDRHVEQLLGDVLDLEHPAPAEGQRRGERARPRGPRARRPAPCAGRRSRRCWRRSGRLTSGYLLLLGDGLRTLRRCGRSGPGTPRRASAGPARTRRSPAPARDSAPTASAARSASEHGADSAAGSGSRWTVPSSPARGAARPRDGPRGRAGARAASPIRPMP